MKLIELQVDRIVGPTHHYGGLGVGNVASLTSKGNTSSPRTAALQGLAKMRKVAGYGVPQAILPPQPRPDHGFLSSLGFAIETSDCLIRIAQQSPEILSAAMSSSAMWTANAATVAASVDGSSGVPILSIANLGSSLHRAIEPTQTRLDLQAVFAKHVQSLAPLPGGAMMRDEGAANHMRFGSDQALPGIHLFVYGDQDPLPKTFWPRQTLAACVAIARRHGLPAENTFFLKQHPRAIDAGAFHNDVVAASHHGMLLHHELAFFDADNTLQEIETRYAEIYSQELKRVVVSEATLPIKEAIATYLFNSQIVSPAAGGDLIIFCPMQVAESKRAKAVLDGWLGQKLFADSHVMELRQSMAGGGGPACLRLRVPLTEQEMARVSDRCRWSKQLDESLCQLIEELYPETMSFDELSNADCIDNAIRVTEKISELLTGKSP